MAGVRTSDSSSEVEGVVGPSGITTPNSRGVEELSVKDGVVTVEIEAVSA